LKKRAISGSHASAGNNFFRGGPVSSYFPPELNPVRPTPVAARESPTDVLRAVLSATSARYCILHSWTSIDQHQNKDVDLAVDPRDLDSLELSIRNCRQVRIVQLIHYRKGGFYLVLHNINEQKPILVVLDVISEYRIEGRVLLTSADLLKERHQWHGLWVAGRESEFAYVVLKRVCKQVIADKHKKRLHELRNSSPVNALKIVERFFGLDWGRRIDEWIGENDWSSFQANFRMLSLILRSHATREGWVNSFSHTLPDLKLLWRRWRHPTGLFVAVLGPDGAGKSTLIKNLANYLDKAFAQPKIFKMRPDIFGRISTPTNPHPHEQELRPYWFSVLKAFYFIIDYCVGYLIWVRPELVRSQLVLFDRYYDDLFVDPMRYCYGGPPGLLRIGSRFVPRPEILFILSAPSNELFARKEELPADELQRLTIEYLVLATRLPNAHVLDAAQSAEDVAARAASLCLKYLHLRYSTRLQTMIGSG
jgi:thymidylate kinase